MKIGDQYLISLTKRKRIFTRPTTRIWYIDTYGREVLDYMSFSKIRRRDEGEGKILATIYGIHNDYIELRLENMRIISVHYEYLNKLEKL